MKKLYLSITTSRLHWLNMLFWASTKQQETAGDTSAANQPNRDLPTHEVQKIRQWIDAKGYLDNNQAVTDITSELGISKYTLHRYFREVVGEELRTWRIIMRIQHAQQLMKQNPHRPITQIAQESGFNDRSFFYNSFLRVTGQTVTQYRQTLSHNKVKVQ